MQRFVFDSSSIY